jgi:oligosaccharyltransferase complex subunit beta
MGGTALPFISLIIVILVCAAPTSTQAQKLLVLLEDMRLKASHSQFFEPLAAGWTLDFKLASDSSLALTEWDTYLYDALIIFGSGINDFGGEVDVHSILDFIDSGHDVFLATDAGATDMLRELATEFGVEFDEKGTTVIDHMSASVTKHWYQALVDETLVAASLDTHQAKILGLSTKKVHIIILTIVTNLIMLVN